jgi:hypothetical protein
MQCFQGFLNISWKEQGLTDPFKLYLFIFANIINNHGFDFISSEVSGMCLQLIYNPFFYNISYFRSWKLYCALIKYIHHN